MIGVQEPPALSMRGFIGKDVPTDEDLTRCVHCGLCLNQCPTYRILRLETDSPRGRLHLIREVAEGARGLSDDVVRHLDLCLVCRACETACPSGVPFGRLMEHARAQIRLQRPMGQMERWVRQFVFDALLPHPVRLRALAEGLRLYQKSGLQSLVRRTGLLRLLPGYVAAMEANLPPLGVFFEVPPSGEFAPQGPERARVAFLNGCVMPLAFGATNAATIRVLTHNGCRVVIPKGQICCGALHAHMGERERAKAMARRNIDAFEQVEVDAILTNAAGCGAMMKEYGDLLQDDAAYAERARRFSIKVRDVTEFLVELPFTPPNGRIEAVATYQDPCHLAHAQGVRQPPRRILASIPGLRFAEMADADHCCGSAGIYNMVHPDIAAELLEKKLAAAMATGADIIVSANPGCMLQLTQGLARLNRRVRLVHVIDLLDEAYRRGHSPM